MTLYCWSHIWCHALYGHWAHLGSLWSYRTIANLYCYGIIGTPVSTCGKGRSRNKQTNLIFHCIHALMGAQQSSVHMRYVPSKENPADDSSWRVYPPTSLLLPRLTIPHKLNNLIIDFDSSITSLEPGTHQHNLPALLPKPSYLLSENEHATFNVELDRRREELLSFGPWSSSWVLPINTLFCNWTPLWEYSVTLLNSNHLLYFQGNAVQCYSWCRVQLQTNKVIKFTDWFFGTPESIRIGR